MTLSYFWILIFFVMIVVEVITVGNLVSVWFALGALGAWLCSFVTDSLAIHVIVFAIVSLVSLLIVRPLAAKALRGNVISTNADSLIGRQFTLSAPILENKWGEIKINGASWSATTARPETLPEGCRVEVIAIEGVKLIVRKIGE